VVFMDYATYGGAKVSWTAPCYILGANFADQMPEDEDPMPLDGNPHPLPGELVPDVHNFVLPPYPALGWNDLPPIPPPVPDHVDHDNWGHDHWGDVAEQHVEQKDENNQPVQDQESMVIDQPIFLDSEVQMNAPVIVEVVVPQQFDANAWAIVPYQPPLIQFDRIIVGAVRVVYGLVLPPELAWRRTFETLLQIYPMQGKQMPMPSSAVEPIVLSKRNWALAFDDVQVVSKLQWMHAPIVSPAKSRPVARNLFAMTDVSEDVTAISPGLEAATVATVVS
jgi:hypothetical protein